MTGQEQTNVRQECETLVRRIKNDSFACRYAYARSADSQSANEPGQDYLVFRLDERTACFVLCDGVSQSFFGDLAARTLGDALIQWLSQLTVGSELADLAGGLGEMLQALTFPASAAVRELRLPPGLPAMVVDVLAEKRERGSESTFVCGRIDLPGPDLPEGRLLLFWMGDSRLRLWRPVDLAGCEAELTTGLGNHFHTTERWSTKRGPVGSEPHGWASPLWAGGQYQIGRLVAYSDGLAALDRTPVRIADGDLQQVIDRTALEPVSDDLSFFEIGWDRQTEPVLRPPPDDPPREAPKGPGLRHKRRRGVAGVLVLLASLGLTLIALGWWRDSR